MEISTSGLVFFRLYLFKLKFFGVFCNPGNFGLVFPLSLKIVSLGEIILGRSWRGKVLLGWVMQQQFARIPSSEAAPFSFQTISLSSFKRQFSRDQRRKSEALEFKQGRLAEIFSNKILQPKLYLASRCSLQAMP